MQTLNRRAKWRTRTRNLKEGDIVFVKDETLTTRSWPLAKIVKVFPGHDGQVRAVDLVCRGKKYWRSSHNLIFLEMEEDHLLSPSAYSGPNEDPEHKEEN